MAQFTYKPKGVCAREMQFDIEDGILKGVKVHGGCDGNLKGLSMLAEGMEANEVAARLKGIDCAGKGTSCPDQLAIALEQVLQN